MSKQSAAQPREKVRVVPAGRKPRQLQSRSGGGISVVALGASAGGLDAFEHFLRAMPADSGMAFVLVQHLDPTHPSILAEILQRSTSMPVLQAEDQMQVEPDKVYVIPPNRDMGIFHGALQLRLPAEPRGQRLPIDCFMRSLAEDLGERAVGIILSGTGTDGTLGLRAILGAGGVTLVQTPASARYDGMPTSAIDAGYATHVLEPDKMPQALLEAARQQPGGAAAAGAPAGASKTLLAGLPAILMLLRSGTGHDFSQYKKNTLSRRIERRMLQHAISDAASYARYLQDNPTEMQALFRELLINVTSFFRDPEAFAVLGAQVLPGLLRGKPAGYVPRVWVAGCSTGEEAYSIAILLREYMDQAGQGFKVQIYATDLDDEAITIARAALYPPNIAQDLSPERLRRFFTKEGESYRVHKEIREMVVFAVQSIIKDPPFTRLDLLSCRNVMIYLSPDLQDRLVSAFHYALQTGGVLFLSPSESVGRHTDFFEPIDRKWKMYRAKASTASARAIVGSGLSWVKASLPHAPAAGGPRATETQLADLAKRSLLQAFAPAAVMTDRQGEVLYVHGDTGKYLRLAPGQPSHNLVDMAREGLATPVREALQQARDGTTPVLEQQVLVQSAEALLAVCLRIQTLAAPDGSSAMLLFSFHDGAATPAGKAARQTARRKSVAEARILMLEREVARAREEASLLLEEQQASNEELKSTNEELQSTNEELQSTNEELETSKEELQSVNEELLTVNAELQGKVEQLAGMRDDMKNLLDNMRLGTIFLDRQMSIRRFTRDAVEIYRLLPSDVGRPLADMNCELRDADLLADARSVLESLVPLEREVHTASGALYLARIQPYRTTSDVIDGVVLTFSDITDHANALASRAAQRLAEGIANTVPTPLLALDPKLRVVAANQAFMQAYGGTRGEMMGQPLYEMRDRLWDFAELHALLDHSDGRVSAFVGRIVEHDFPGLGHLRLRISAHAVVDQPGDAQLTLLAIEVDQGLAR